MRKLAGANLLSTINRFIIYTVFLSSVLFITLHLILNVASHAPPQYSLYDDF